jgi:glycosyltransferase involved in cell wall biosynthesis
MKIAIYGIAKNESKFVERFLSSIFAPAASGASASTSAADYVIICDTGSTDGTRGILRRGATVHEIRVSPWRFDLARNTALLHLPPDTDIAISMDIDEVLLPGWREAIESAWIPGQTTMLRYPFVHNWEDREQTIPRLSVWGFKVHCPKSYIWKYPIHETLELRDTMPDGTPTHESVAIIDREIIRHYPDPDKQERWNRIEVFRQNMQEFPDCQRMAHLYGRELYFHRQYKEAIIELKRHLSITEPYLLETKKNDPDGIGQTRSTTCRLIARSLMALNADPNEIMVWLMRAVSESPYQREPWMALAEGWLTVGDYVSAYAAAERGFAIKSRLNSIEIEEWCWDERAEQVREEAKRKLFEGKIV